MSQLQQATLDRLVSFYQSLDARPLSELAEIYHPEICLRDPVGQHQGLPQLEHYFSGLMKNLRYCRFDVTLARQFDDDALLLWRMNFAHPALQRGAAQQLEGSSYLQFTDDKIHFQQDYYDLGAMLYDKLPLLGAVTGLIKRRLRP